MPVIALVGNKGGAGKTTLSVNLATCLAKQATIAVVDADPQGSALQWHTFSEKENAVEVFEANENLHEQATGLLKDYQYVLFDCPPSVHAAQTTSILKFCDIALVPVQPSPVDLWATVHIEEAIEKARESNPSLKAWLVINQLEPRTTLSRFIRDALSEIALPVASTALRRRAIFRNSVLEGKSVFDMGRRGTEAVGELEQLVQEVITR